MAFARSICNPQLRRRHAVNSSCMPCGRTRRTSVARRPGASVSAASAARRGFVDARRRVTCIAPAQPLALRHRCDGRPGAARGAERERGRGGARLGEAAAGVPASYDSGSAGGAQRGASAARRARGGAAALSRLAHARACCALRLRVCGVADAARSLHGSLATLASLLPWRRDSSTRLRCAWLQSLRTSTQFAPHLRRAERLQALLPACPLNSRRCRTPWRSWSLRRFRPIRALVPRWFAAPGATRLRSLQFGRRSVWHAHEASLSK